jgi:hypothetical protein
MRGGKMSAWMVSSLLGISVMLAAGVQYRGRYVNHDYGFEITIPTGYVGLGAAATAPNHGFAIEAHDRSIVSVDASYDTIVGPSGESFEEQMTRSNGPPTATLAGMRAWKYSRETAQGSQLIFQQGIVARHVSEQGDPIIYTISESTDEKNRGSTDSLYEKIVSSFRIIPIR